VRKLYADEDLQVFNNCRAFMINGIGEFVYRPDLIERALILSLPSMPEGARKSEKRLFMEFNSILPGILGCLFDAVAAGLRNEALIDEPTNVRMTDAAAWLKAAEPATGLPEGTLLRAIEESQTTSMVDRIRNDPLMIALEHIIKDAPFEGRMSDLFDRVSVVVERPDRYFPRTPAHLSKALARLKPAAAKADVFIDLPPRTREGRRLRIWRPGQEGMPPAKNEPWMTFSR
jgi:hypothetical protein